MNPQKATKNNLLPKSGSHCFYFSWLQKTLGTQHLRMLFVKNAAFNKIQDILFSIRVGQALYLTERTQRCTCLHCWRSWRDDWEYQRPTEQNYAICELLESNFLKLIHKSKIWAHGCLVPRPGRSPWLEELMNGLLIWTMGSLFGGLLVGKQLASSVYAYRM